MRTVSKARWAGLAAALLAVGFAVTGTASSASAATNSGFIEGTDSWPVSPISGTPYHLPASLGSYGGYIGMAGNWARHQGCSTGNFLAWSSANSAQANVNLTKYNIGIGTGVYWYMGGPGVDPKWNGTAAEAFKWGVYQAELTLDAVHTHSVYYPVIWADIEQPGIAPAPDNGWNKVYTSPCSGVVKQLHTPSHNDRAELNGFAAYITTHSKFKVGVYSAVQDWNTIFGTGPDSKIPNTYEWVYTPETSNLSAAPVGWCLRGNAGCAQWFGGQSASSKYALMWQWSGGDGIRNAYGDFDQIDVARMK